MNDLRRRESLLETALLVTFFVHGIAMLLMAFVLARFLPGGPTHQTAERIGLIALHPWAYRLGWAGWQVTALSDLFLAVALFRTPWIPRLPAIVTVVTTVLAVIPDQWAQVQLVVRGPTLAALAVRSHDPSTYLRFEAHIFPLTAAWAACFYTLGAVAWTWCFASAGTWSRTLTWLSAIVWPVFAIVSVGAILPPALRLPDEFVAAGNALGFLLLELWLVLVTEQVLRKARPITPHGAWAEWRHPAPGLRGRLIDALATSRFLHTILSCLPDLGFLSDITDVIYVNYLAPAALLEPFVPEGLVLQRVGHDRSLALFTFLSYRHGHFAPKIAGPFRRFAPSPIQSNWRIYAEEPHSGRTGIYFVTNAVTSTLYAIAARLLADGMPMHVPKHAELRRDEGGLIRLQLDPGAGTAPDVIADLHSTPERALPPAFAEAFGSYDAFLETCVPQDRAMSSQPWRRVITCHEIHLGIAPSDCLPLAGTVQSRAAAAIVGPDAIPFCFLVERVAFRLNETTRSRYPHPESVISQA